MAGQRVYKRGDRPNWYTTIAGKCLSTGCRDKRAAEAWSAQRERAAYAPDAASASPPLREALARAVADRKLRERAQGTLEMWDVKRGHLARIFGDETPLSQIDAKAIDAYVAQRSGPEEGASLSTIGKELGVLRVTLKLAARRDEYPHDIAKVFPVGLGTDYKPRERSLSPEEARKLLSDLLDDELPMVRAKPGPARSEKPQRPDTGPASLFERTRQRSMANRAACVAFIVATSARWSEAERARRDDVILFEGGGFVTLRGTKTKGARRVVPVLATTAPLLRIALEHGRDSGELFEPWQNVRRDLHSACRRLRIPPVSPNDLRRTTAQWLRSAGVEPHLIAAVLGHADARMVERVYGKITPEALGEALRARVGGVVPLLPVATKGKRRTG